MPHARESLAATQGMRIVKHRQTVSLTIRRNGSERTLLFPRSQYLAVLSFANLVAEIGELKLEQVDRDVHLPG